MGTSSWTIGTGSVTGFSQYGSTNENIRGNGKNHVGENVILWKALPSSNSGASGGWDSTPVAISPNNSYRFSVWIKKSNSDSGTSFFGAKSYVSGSSHIQDLTNNTITYPYFWSGDLPLLDRWYLLVGYIHKSNYNSSVHLGRLYDGVTGEEVLTLTDFKFKNTATVLRHSAYLWTGANAPDVQFYYAPRIDIVNNTMPTTNDLLSINPDSKLIFAYDNAGNQKQRFYCLNSTCITPNPPAGRAVAESIETDEAIVETNNEESHTKPFINISPNPTKGKFTIQLVGDDYFIKDLVSIYQTNGALLQTIAINKQPKTLDLDISNSPDGMYYIHIHLSNGSSVTKKIIKH